MAAMGQAEWEAARDRLNEICNKNPSFAEKQAEWEARIEMQKEDLRPMHKRPRVGDVGRRSIAPIPHSWEGTHLGKTGLDSQTSTNEPAKTAQDIEQPLMKEIATAVQSSAASAAGAAAAAVEEAKQRRLMKQSPQQGGEAAAPQVDYTAVLLDRIYSIGFGLQQVQEEVHRIYNCARTLEEEVHRILAAQQALRCSLNQKAA